MGLVAKYCNECICLFASMSPAALAIFTKLMHVAYGRGLVLWRVTQSQWEGAIFGVFFPLTMQYEFQYKGPISLKLNLLLYHKGRQNSISYY